MRRRICCVMVYLAALALIGCAGATAPPPSPGPVSGPRSLDQTEPWRLEWDKAVAGARKEGVVRVLSDWGPKPREAVIRTVRERYGLEVEVTTSGASEAAPKVIAERRAGLYNYDIAVHGGSFGIRYVKPEGVLDPIEPALILPEAKDPKVWLGGAFPWFDHDRTMIQFFAKLDSHLAINTDMVREGEITSFRDVLEPKWKGKILLKDPTIVGSGTSWFRGHRKNLGDDYMRALAKQEPAVLRDNRQCVEWLARGKYSILVAGDPTNLADFVKDGAPVAMVGARDSRVLGAASGQVMLVNRAPHPNAARLFLNWLLTREGQTVMTRALGVPSRRLDVPAEGILPVFVPQPGEKYYEETEQDMVSGERDILLAREIFGSLLPR
ncbi:MAG: extracellular solute-binding protein [Chloroflexi bacterium]|nr:extracellular solute-binding protein [Chloroflexota bacterium]